MTDQQRAVLAHVVVDPDAWLAHAVERFGEVRAAQMLEAKANRWQADYEAAIEGKELFQVLEISPDDEEVITTQKRDIPDWTGYKTRAEIEAKK